MKSGGWLILPLVAGSIGLLGCAEPVLRYDGVISHGVQWHVRYYEAPGKRGPNRMEFAPVTPIDSGYASLYLDRDGDGVVDYYEMRARDGKLEGAVEARNCATAAEKRQLELIRTAYRQALEIVQRRIRRRDAAEPEPFRKDGTPTTAKSGT